MSHYTVCAYKTNATNALIDWSKYFDKIYCIHFLPDRDKKNEISKELDRVGIAQSPIFQFHYTYPNTYDILAAPRMVEQFRNTKVVNLALAYYNIILESLWLGHQHILILEDDVRFTQDLISLKTLMDQIPNNYDYIHYDKILSNNQAKRRETIVSGEYYDSNYTGGYWGTAMTAYSRNAMVLMANILTHILLPADWILENREDKNLEQLKRYVAHDIIVMQQGREDEYKEGKF